MPIVGHILAVPDVAGTLRSGSTSPKAHGKLNGTDRMDLVACFKGGQGSKARGIGYSEHIAPTLSSADSGSNRAPVAMIPGVAFDCKASGSYGFQESEDTASTTMIPGITQVRRLTPVECARLQGFPDFHARIPWRKKPAEECPDGPQYKAYGNSMCTKVMFWIGQRVDAVLQKATK